MKQTAPVRRPTVGVATYRADPLYPRIARAVAAILRHGTVVAPVDVLVGMGLLEPDHLEAWRRGRVPYLEQVITGNLTRLARLLRILRFHAHDLNLEPVDSSSGAIGTAVNHAIAELVPIIAGADPHRRLENWARVRG